MTGSKVEVRDSAGDLRFRGEDSFRFGDSDLDGGGFFLEALDMRTSKAEREEADIVRTLGFELVEFNKFFEEREMEVRRGSFAAILRERVTRIEVWRHEESENINRG